MFLEKNARWPTPDKDYTPNMNYLSAVWPQLRYNAYVVAVLNAKSMDATTYYKQISTLSLPDPCNHTEAIKCTRVESKCILNTVVIQLNQIHLLEELKLFYIYIYISNY